MQVSAKQATTLLKYRQGGSDMEEIRNASNKLVCCIDKSNRVVEISIKGCTTRIRFLNDGNVEIQNAKKAA